MVLRGKVWKYGDDLVAYKILNPKWSMGENAYMKLEERAKHLFEDMDPDFQKNYKKGDIVVAGKSFSYGHMHYTNPVANCLVALGISALVAESMPDSFLKLLINSGIPVFDRKEIIPMVKKGDELEIDLVTGKVRNITTGTSIKVKPMGKIVLNILEAGGMDGYVKQRLPTLKPWKKPSST